MPNQYSIELQTGKLQVSVLSAKFSLDTLLTFGSRLNPKRRFLFVSKVLGKYVPCKPSVMRESYQAIAQQVQALADTHKTDITNNTWVLGVAETATGLGAGVAQEVKRMSDGVADSDVIYSHTTRCSLEHSIDFSIIEEHSHAPSHLIYQLDHSLGYEEVSRVVLVDDEISTGRTLAQLTDELLQRLPKLTTVVWASLVNWISTEDINKFKASYPNISLHFCSLLYGTFEFNSNPNFTDELPDNTATGISNMLSRADIGRVGYSMSKLPTCQFVAVADGAEQVETPVEALTTALLDISSLDKTKRYTIIGTGEFSYQPFLFAEQLQQQGFDVLFQSTGRSPAIEDCGIASKMSRFDQGHQGVYYLYNLPEDRENILCYENEQQLKHCPFKDDIKAQTVILERFKY